jgi:outer membrane protein assembly factor BamD (BamD/ComL family)
MARPTPIRRLVVTLLCAGAWPAAAQPSPDTLFQDALGRFAAAQYAEAVRGFKELADRFGAEPELAAQMEPVYYGLGCSYYNTGEYEQAIPAFEAYLAKYPAARFADEAMFRIGAARQTLQQYDQAIAAYQRLPGAHPRSPYAEDAAFQAGICKLLQSRFPDAAAAFAAFEQTYPESDLLEQAVMFRARARFENRELEAAVAALESLEGRRRKLDHVVYANFLAVDVGDEAFDNTDYDLALRAYRRVRTRESLLRLQREWVAGVRREMETALAQKPDLQQISARFRQERRLRAAQAQAEEMLNKLEEMPDYDASLFHRIGRCFFNNDRYWEARVAFERVMAEAKDEKTREAAHFDLILVLSRMRRFEDLVAEADGYLARYE